MSRPGLAVYRHPTAGFALPLPADWERAEDAAPGVALIAVEPEHGGYFRANLVVTLEELAPGLSLESWQAEAEQLVPGMLEGYMLLDRERVQLNGRDVLRRLAHYVRPETGSITMEQWTAVAGDRGFTLTASVGTLEYDELADALAGMTGQLRVEGPLSSEPA